MVGALFQTYRTYSHNLLHTYKETVCSPISFISNFKISHNEQRKTEMNTGPGTGITQAFENNTKRDQQQTGRGLSQSYNLVKLLQPRMLVDRTDSKYEINLDKIQKNLPP